MSTVTLFTDPQTIVCKVKGHNTGVIYLRFGEQFFPAQHWDDFVLLILTELSAAMRRLFEDSRASEHVHFMDGPYMLELRREQAGILGIKALSQRTQCLGAAYGEVGLVEFADDLIRQSTQVLHVCRTKSCTTEEADHLREATVLLQRTVDQERKSRASAVSTQ